MPNSFKIIMGVTELNRILDINLSVHDIEDVYDLCKSEGGNKTYYLWGKANRECIVNDLEDSNRYAGDDRLFISGNWEFSGSAPEVQRVDRIPRGFGTPSSKDRILLISFTFLFLFCRIDIFCLSCRRPPEETEANRVGWVRNDAWFRGLFSYRGHSGRAAWALLNYEPRYHSFIKRKTSQLQGGCRAAVEEERIESVADPDPGLLWLIMVLVLFS